MAGTLRQYDPKQVTASWGVAGGPGVDLLADAVQGTFLEVARAVPTFSNPRADRQGNAVRTRTHDGTGTLTVRMTAEGPTNAILSALATSDRVSENIVGSITVKDLNGDTVCIYTGCYITTIPSPSYGQEAGERVWMWGFADHIEFIAGQDKA